MGVLSEKLDVINGKHKWLPVLYTQVQVVDQTTPPLSWNSFVGTGIQDRPVPPAKLQSMEMASEENCSDRLKVGLLLFFVNFWRASRSCSIRNRVVCISNA